MTYFSLAPLVKQAKEVSNRLACQETQHVRHRRSRVNRHKRTHIVEGGTRVNDARIETAIADPIPCHALLKVPVTVAKRCVF